MHGVVFMTKILQAFHWPCAGREVSSIDLQCWRTAGGCPGAGRQFFVPSLERNAMPQLKISAKFRMSLTDPFLIFSKSFKLPPSKPWLLRPWLIWPFLATNQVHVWKSPSRFLEFKFNKYFLNRCSQVFKYIFFSFYSLKGVFFEKKVRKLFCPDLPYAPCT